MRRVPDNYNTIEFDLSEGRLLGGRKRVPLGSAEKDFRVLLNTDTARPAGRRRMGGWKRPGSPDTPSNDDLHDQLLGGSYQYVGGVATPIAGQREVITLIGEGTSFDQFDYAIVATKSRIYSATGQSRNWRLIADGMGGVLHEGQSPWPAIRTTMAQMGNYAIFSNNSNPVLAWQLGAPTLDTGIYADRRWAAFPIEELAAIGVFKAAGVAAWGGFVFAWVGSILYWSDFNRPLEWFPTSQSLAGFYDFGGGEVITNVAPIGGSLRVYTTRAIYSGEFIGAPAVFSFPERYRGSHSVAYPESFVNLGDAHAWLTADEMVIVNEFDRTPRLLDYMHAAMGFVFDGLDGAILKDCPVPFAAFGPIDKDHCWQIAAGFDGVLGDLWLSWPTTSADENDFEGVRRMTLRINTRYEKVTLIDHGFSAFGSARLPRWPTLSDFMLEWKVCESPDGPASPEALYANKEGAPLNAVTITDEDPPLYIWNETEDPSLPMDPVDSLASRVCDIYLDEICVQCRQGNKQFLMASTKDFAIKQFTPDTYERDEYDLAADVTYAPVDANNFPNVRAGAWNSVGYPTLIQQAEYQPQGPLNKMVNRIGVEMDALEQEPPGKLHVQLGTANTPGGMRWDASPAQNLDVRPDTAAEPGEVKDLRPARPVTYAFYRAGVWLAHRAYVTDAAGSTSPKDCAVSLSQLQVSLKPKNTDWTKV